LRAAQTEKADEKFAIQNSLFKIDFEEIVVEHPLYTQGQREL